MTGGERAHIGVATFDSMVHFYPLRQGQEQAQMLVVPDVNDVYCPLPSGLLVPIAHARPMVSCFPHRPVHIPTSGLPSNFRLQHNCNGAAGVQMWGIFVGFICANTCQLS